MVSQTIQTILLLIAFFNSVCSTGLKLRELKMNSTTEMPGQSILLTCDFELGYEVLYAVKWYKGQQEFFRYLPMGRPETMYFHTKGVEVDNSKSFYNSIVLKNISTVTSGNYTCEVATDAPIFTTAKAKKELKVIEPLNSPQITGDIKESYQIGDLVQLICVSGKAKPPVLLKWFLNDEPVKGDKFTEQVNAELFLEEAKVNATSKISFKLMEQDFKYNRSQIKCEYMFEPDHQPSSNTIILHLENPESIQIGLNGQQQTKSLKLRELKMSPTEPMPGRSLLLTCDFELRGDELYAVKWYKDQMEFYRYLPNEGRSFLNFHAKGVEVDEIFKLYNSVVLKNISTLTSGTYTCEVSTEGPTFATATASKMVKVVERINPPEIIGDIKEVYQIGDQVNLTCVTRRAHPLVDLKWFINGAPVYQFNKRMNVEQNLGVEGVNATLKVTFRLKEQNFKQDGRAEIRCDSVVEPLQTSSSVVLHLDRPEMGQNGQQESDFILSSIETVILSILNVLLSLL